MGRLKLRVFHLEYVQHCLHSQKRFCISKYIMHSLGWKQAILNWGGRFSKEGQNNKIKQKYTCTVDCTAKKNVTQFCFIYSIKKWGVKDIHPSPLWLQNIHLSTVTMGLPLPGRFYWISLSYSKPDIICIFSSSKKTDD